MVIYTIYDNVFFMKLNVYLHYYASTFWLSAPNKRFPLLPIRLRAFQAISSWCKVLPATGSEMAYTATTGRNCFFGSA